MFMSGRRLRDGDPKVCANEGRDCGGWVTISFWEADMGVVKKTQQRKQMTGFGE